MKCDQCKKDDYKLKFVKKNEWLCRDCSPKSSYSYMRFLWRDGSGSYTLGWYNDVSHRKVVGSGEVVRDYGKKYSFNS